MRRLKTWISIALVLTMLFSLGMTAFAAPADEAEPKEKDTKIYFDANSSGWQDFEKVGFYVWEPDSLVNMGIAWGSKKLYGTDEGDGIWSYDVMSNFNLRDGVQYVIVFFNSEDTMHPTHNLLFDTTCLGSVAYCDGTYENPYLAGETIQAAFWRDKDATVYGPEMMFTATGNVVGTCVAANTTAYDLFVEFLEDRLNSARANSDKTDQEIINDVASALGLDQSEIRSAIDATGVAVDWLAPYEPHEVELSDEIAAEVLAQIKETTQLDPEGILAIRTLAQLSDGRYLIGVSYAAELDWIPTEYMGGYLYRYHGHPAYIYDRTEHSFESVITTYRNGRLDEATLDELAGYLDMVKKLIGDADLDGEVTIFDATTIQREIAKMAIDRFEAKLADADGDGEVTIFDATMIQRCVARMIAL